MHDEGSGRGRLDVGACRPTAPRWCTAPPHAPTPSSTTAAPGRRAARAGRGARRPGRVPGPQRPRPDRDAVRHGGARCRVRAAQLAAHGHRARLHRRRLRTVGARPRPGDARHHCGDGRRRIGRRRTRSRWDGPSRPSPPLRCPSSSTRPSPSTTPPSSSTRRARPAGPRGRRSATATSWNCVNVLIDTELAADEVALVCAPLFHVAALDMISLPTLMKGGTVVLMGAFEPDAVLRLIAEHRVTVMFGVPAMFNAMAQVPAFPSADLSSLRRLLCGGAPVPLSTIHTYLDRGIAFLQRLRHDDVARRAVPRRRARRRQSRHRRGAVLLHRRAGRVVRRPRREAGREGRGRRGRAQRDAGLLGRRTPPPR